MFILTLTPFVSSELILGDESTDIPIVVIQQAGVGTVNYSMVNVNNSFYWQGYTPSTLPHNGLAGLQGGQSGEEYHLNQSLWQRIVDFAFLWVTNATGFVPYQGATADLNLSDYNISSGGVYISPGGQYGLDKTNLTNAFIFYNGTSKRVELWANGKIQQDWGNSTTIYGKATFEADAFFQNLSGTGLVINTNVLVLGNVTSDNVFSGNICYSDGTNCTGFNSSITNLTTLIFNINQTLYASIQDVNSSLYNYTYNVNQSLTQLFNSMNMSNYYTKQETYNKSEIDSFLLNKLNVTDQRYNDTLFIENVNQTLTNLSKVKAHQENLTIITSGGLGHNTSSSLLGFLITRIKIIPSSLTSNYKSLAYENSSGNIIDQDRATHIGVWDIEKNYAINDRVVINITNSNPAIETYTVNIYYIDNFRP
jgi:hypothetical protein